MKNVLVIEDDKEIVNLLEIHLKDISCNVVKAYQGYDGLDIALRDPIDLVILDINLPDIDGIEVCQKIRSKSQVPIIFLTARSEEIDRVLGLEIGADDYITKPFSVREFIARVKAIFRRSQRLDHATEQAASTTLLQYGELAIDIEKRKVTLQGEAVYLSPKEFELLVLMASKPGRSYSRSDLLRLIWGYDFTGYEHTVNSHINRLRSKIEKNMNSPLYIKTTWGVGYRFNEDLV